MADAKGNQDIYERTEQETSLMPTSEINDDMIYKIKKTEMSLPLFHLQYIRKPLKYLENTPGP